MVGPSIKLGIKLSRETLIKYTTTVGNIISPFACSSCCMYHSGGNSIM